MNLSPKDRKTLEQIRKSEALSKKMRWVMAVIVATLFGLLIHTASKLNEFRDRILEDDGFSAEIMAFGLPMFYLRLTVSACVAGIFLGLAIKNWNGNKTHQLILGIVDAIEKDESEPGEVVNASAAAGKSENHLHD